MSPTGTQSILSLRGLAERGIISPLTHATTLSALRLSGEEDERVGIALALAQTALRLGHLGLRLSSISSDFSPEILRELKEREWAELEDDQLSIQLNPLENEKYIEENWSGLPEHDEWLACLQCSPAIWWTHRSRETKPFVLDGDVLFTLKAWRGEARVAHTIHHLTKVNVGPIPYPSKLWTRLFAEDALAWFDGGARWDRSKLALYSAMRGAITVIHGGPGTGKTTLTQRILAALLEQYSNSEDPLKIAITAPTGKAAQRLTESIQSRATFFHLPDEIQAQLSTLQGLTLHSLLGIAPGRRAEYHSGHSLPYDVIVVDECSMVDLWLLQSLLEAISTSASQISKRRLLLIGDPQQLPSVSAGAPFTELCGSRGQMASPMLQQELVQFKDATDTTDSSVQSLTGSLNLISSSDHINDVFVDRVVALNQVRRVSADSGIHAAATAIQNVDQAGVKTVLECFKSDQYYDTQYFEAPPFPKVLFEEVLQHAQRTISLVKIRPEEALLHLKSLCLLSPHYGGTLGVNELNEAVEAELRKLRIGGWGRGYIGRPILITQNHPATGLVNGDVGIIGLDHLVYFEGHERPIKLDQLPPHRTVFAMSIHKSQGSEFKKIVMCIPPKRSPIMTRELIYTGLTRAKANAVLVGNVEVLSASILAQVDRGGQLSARIARLSSAVESL